MNSPRIYPFRTLSVVDRLRLAILPICIFIYSSSSAQISGTVFRDYNLDGIQQVDEPLLEGVVVNAYNSAGALCATTSTAGLNSPNYTIDGCTGAQRIEFEIINHNCSLSNFVDFSGYLGQAYGSSVQFVTNPATEINFAVSNPGDYEPTNNPEILIPCYVNGNPLGNSASGALDWFVSFPYGNSGTQMPTHKLNGRILGSVWGVAYSRPAKKIFTSAFLKRHVGLGVMGTGGIYMIDYSANIMGTITQLYDMDANGHQTRASGSCGLAYGNGNSYTITGQTVTYNGPIDPATGQPCGLGVIGTNVQRALPDDPLQPGSDPAAFDQVGKVSLGGIEISDDGKYLYVVNLYDRRLYRLELNNVNNPTSVISVMSWAIPSTSCGNGVLRPWGLKYYRGTIYVGAVCSAENGGSNDNNDDGISDMQSYVYSFDTQNNTFEGSPIVTIPLDYLKGRLRPGLPGALSGNKWNPWTNNFEARLHLPGESFSCYPSPILSDIEFTEKGDMMLSFTDRAGHQFGTDNYNLTGSQIGLSNISGGDLLMAEMEDCLFVTEADGQTTTLTGSGVDNNQGHGGGEFFGQDAHPQHEETVQGALAGLRLEHEIISTVIAPIMVNTGGTKRFSSVDGTLIPNSPYQLYGSTPNFGKANGLGDMECKFLPSPLEVGNRVWYDINENGVQDPSEAPIPNVPLQISLANVIVGVTSTNADGEYYFNLSNVNLNGASGLLPFTSYQISIQAIDFPVGYQITLANVGGNGQPDVRDNDGILMNGNAVISFNTKATGQNDHTLDFGFVTCPNLIIVDTINTPSACNQATGYAEVIVSGNAPSYSYSWIDGQGVVISTANFAANLVPGIYVVHIFSEGNTCQVQDSIPFIIESINGPTVNVTLIVPADCGFPTGAITITVNGGTPPYVIEWSNGSSGMNLTNLPAGMYSVTVTDALGCEGVEMAIVPGPQFPVGIDLISIDSVDCETNTGSIDISVNGGTPPYMYLWSNGSTNQDLLNVPPGSYQVTVTDSQSCTKSSVFELEIGGPNDDCCPIITIESSTQTTTPCGANSATAAVVVTGSPQGNLFSWENSIGTVVSTDSIATGLGPDTYTVYVTPDVPGCSASVNTSVLIVELPGPDVSVISTTNAICTAANGSITISIQQGSPVYTYLWSNGSTQQNLVGVPAGNYTVTVTDQFGCTDTASSTISASPGTLSAEATATPTDCDAPSGTASVLIEGASGNVQILWSNGATTAMIQNLAAGMYTVTVTDALGCQDQDNVEVVAPDAPALTAVESQSVNCFGGSNGSIDITVEDGVAAIVYNDQNEIVGSDPQVIGLPAGIYLIVASDTDGCETEALVEIHQPSSPLLFVLDAVTPSDCDDLAGSIFLTVGGGTTPYSYLWSNGAITEDLLNVGSGDYSVTVTDANGCSFTTLISILQIDGCCPAVVDVLAVPSQELCNGTMTQPVQFNSTFPGVQFIWTNPDPSIGLPAFGFGSIPAFTAINTTADPKNIVIQVAPFFIGNAETCFGTVGVFNLTINPTPLLQLQPTAAICEGGSVVLQAFSSGDCVWTPTAYLDNPNSCTPVASPPITTEYTVVTTNEEGCQAIDQIVVFIHNPGSLACNNLVQISLDGNGEAFILPDMILEGIDDDLELYGVMITTMDNVPVPNPVTCAYIGQTLIVKVFDMCGPNSCWGKIVIEDKLAPVLECNNVTIDCDDTYEPGQNGISFPNLLVLNETVFAIPGVPHSYSTALLDNCGPVTLSYIDQVIATDCSGPYWATRLRTWTATDPSGNSSSCVQSIFVLRTDIDDIVTSGNYDGSDHPMLNCQGSWDVNGNNYPDPSETGFLTGLGCNLQGTFNDVVIPICPGSFKVVRYWTVLDWCTGNIQTFIQLIKVLDNVSPSIQCPANLTVSTDQFSCKSTFTFPSVIVSDICSEPVSVQINGPGFQINQNGGLAQNIPIGEHTVVYTATDACGNTASCSVHLSVRDEIKPEAVCDQHTTVALLQNGTARVFAGTFDDGSYDNCSIDSFVVRRMNPVPACGIDTKFRKYVDFCCADVVSSPVQVVFRVYDKSGNFNECMVFVTVQDKTPPVIVCPPNITIDCDYPFDVWDLTGFGSVRKLESERKNIWLRTKKLVFL
ncbi:MAG: SdrD B-like domain-containing protein, partial [Saprospiraceae bacterium]